MSFASAPFAKLSPGLIKITGESFRTVSNSSVNPAVSTTVGTLTSSAQGRRVGGMRMLYFVTFLRRRGARGLCQLFCEDLTYKCLGLNLHEIGCLSSLYTLTWVLKYEHGVV